jgi:hypothetical protein
VAKARGSYREAVHRLKILSDFYAQIEVKGVEALLADQAASLWQTAQAQAMKALESAKSSPACAAVALCRPVLFFSVSALDVAIG